MLIKFSCVHCRGPLEVNTTAVGAQTACPHCGKAITIPKQGIGPGATLGGFKVERKLAAGGMGEIYIARQLSMDRVVALKILPQHLGMQKEMSDRFLHELKLLARLEHPNIVTAFDAGEDAGILYFAMAYIQGESLEARIKREGFLPERPALELTRKLASALAYAWNKHQLLHRDIKPSNVLLDEAGEPKLVDFGLAKSVSAQAGLTLSNVIMGTPNYMSPEQIEDSAKVGVGADMYSMGATLYHAVTGQIPFAGSSALEVIKKQLSEPLPDPREFNPDLSDGAVALLEILLAKDRGERPGTWEAASADMDRVLAGEAPLTTSPKTGHSTLIRVRDQAVLAELKGKRPRLKGRKEASVEGEGANPRPSTLDPRPFGSPKALWLAGAGVAALVLIGVILWLRNSGKPEARPTWVPTPIGTSLTSAVSGTSTVQQAYRDSSDAGRQEKATAKKKVPVGTGTHVGPNSDWDPSESEKVPVGTGTHVGPNSDLSREALDRQAYMSALEYKDAHPDDMKGILSRFESVKKDAAGTEYQAKAEEQLKRLEDLRKQATEKAWLALKAEVDKLVAAGKLQEAVDKLGQFNGDYAAETVSAREALAGEFKARLAETTKVKEAELEKESRAADLRDELAAAAKKEEARKLLSSLRHDMAGKLLAGDFPGAAACVKAAKTNGALAELSAEVTEDEQLLQKLARLPEMLAESFNKDKGKEVAIEFKTGQTTPLQITGVEGRTVKARRVLPQGFAEQNFAVGDISANERLKRLTSNPTPEAAILRGLAAYETRNAALAGKEFSSVEGRGSRGEDRVGLALAEAVKEATARKDLVTLLKLAGFTGELPEPDKIDFGAKTWTTAQADRLKAATKEYQRLHGQTQTAKTYADALTALAAIQASSTATNVALPPIALATGGVQKPEVFEKVPMKEPTEENLKKALEELKADNPAVKDLKETHKITAEGIELSIAGRDNASLDNIKALAGLPITILNISTTKVKDLKPLYGMPLKDFASACTLIEDIRPLTNSPIENMEIWGTPVRDFSPLRNIKGLRWLSVFSTSFCDRDFKHIQGHPLTFLNISSCRVKNIETLRGMPLETFYAESTLIEDISPLADAPLVTLNLRLVPIKDIKPLSGKRLTSLDLMGTWVTDLSPLTGMPLKTLLVGRSPSKSRIAFNPLAGMPMKRLELYVGWEESPDIDKLPEYLPDLETLLLDFCQQPTQCPAFVLKFEYLKSVEILFSGKGTKMTPAEYRKKYFSKPEGEKKK